MFEFFFFFCIKFDDRNDVKLVLEPFCDYFLLPLNTPSNSCSSIMQVSSQETFFFFLFNNYCDFFF